MRLLVCGDRNWSDEKFIFNRLDEFLEDNPVEVLIEGEARGADTIAAKWGVKRKIKVLRFPADWNKYGKAAGPIRNKQMLDEGKPDIVIAFHDKFDESRGTKNMVEQAAKANVGSVILNHGYQRNCKECKDIKEEGGIGPSHFASSNCESGRYTHCSCDICF